MERSTAEQRSERRMRAWRLRLAGHTLRAISLALGISLGQVHADLAAVRAELAAQEMVAAEEYRLLQYARAEGVVAALWERVESGDVRAIDRLLRCLDFENRLLGLYDSSARPLLSARGELPEGEMREQPEWWARV